MIIKVGSYNFEVCDPVCAGRNGGRSSFGDDEIVLSTDKSGRNAIDKYSMRITISEKLAKKARLMVGDRVRIAFDKQNLCGIIRRVTEGGYQLCGSNRKTSRLYVKPTLRIGSMPSTASPVGCVADVTDDGIIFMLPDSVSFVRNLRLESEAKKKGELC